MGDLLKSTFQSAITLIVFTIFIILGVREVTAPVLRLSEAANRIADGDFDVDIPDTPRKDEIGQLERSFQVMAKELKSTQYLQKDFISNVSHEYKTPLAVIAGYVKLLCADDLPPEERALYGQFILEETDRLSQMTSNILLLSKLENLGIAPTSSRIALDEQLRQAILLYFPRFQEKNITLDIEVPPLIIEGNEELLMHVWTNLLGNAAKFTEPGGTVWIEAHADALGVSVTVKDNGIGMDDETKARIFDQFYQGDTSRQAAGNGLGLALVSRIVQLHKGSILVESAPGEGASFGVMLPGRLSE